MTSAGRLRDLVEGFWSTQVIRASAELGVPEILGRADLGVDELAREAGAHAPSLDRLLRAMVTLGLCEAAAPGRYRLTEMGLLLRPGVDGSLHRRVLFAGRALYPAFADLAECVRTGRKAPSVRGEFESSTPEQVIVSQNAMAEISREAMRSAVAAYDFGQYSSLLDVGGGFGGVTAFLLERYPGMRADIFDLPNSQSGAEAYLAAHGVHSRARFLPGDFLGILPTGYDCYFYKYILHDWDDAKSAAILASCRASISPDARLVLMEVVVPDRLADDDNHRAVMRTDMTMMTWGGKERTAAEYESLLRQAHFEMIRVVPTGSAFCLIEGRPV